MNFRPLLFAAGIALLLSIPFLTRSPRTTAQACWNNVLIECFDNDRTTWPWVKPTGVTPVRRWRVTPNPASQLAWGMQDRYYSVALETFCQGDEQACWCIGGPATEDPEVDHYPGNLTTYMTYGPVNLSTATEGRVEFSLYFLNNLDFGDTITWGADSVFTLAASHIWIDSTLYNQTEDGWMHFSMDLKTLYRNNATHDSVSALGRSDVYIFWWFKSDGDQQWDKGAFVDDIIIAWDDGTYDLLAGGLDVLEPDSVTTPTRIEEGDEVVFKYTWSTCNGGVSGYPPYHVVLTLNGEPILDSLMMDSPPDTTYTWYTAPMVMEAAGEYTVEMFVDAQNDVPESDEDNNTQLDEFIVWVPNAPPTFEWLSPGPQSPGGDTLFTDSLAVLRWSLTDPDDEAWISVYYDQDTTGCLGPVVPSGLNRTETASGIDSIQWNTRTLINGTVRWPFVLYGDFLFSECVYAPWPVKVERISGSDEVILRPVTFHLAQNYPNPFNPTTEIEFGVVRGGHTTLTVYDITGREVQKLIDNDLTPGIYTASFGAGVELPSGVYLYRLDSPEGVLTRKMILMK